MAVVQSLGQLATMELGWTPAASYGALTLYNQHAYDYATLYRTQPNVRTCVDFLARNIAQLGLHVYRRVSDTDRERLTEHGLARTLSMPLPASMKVTRYRLIESLVADLGIYFNAFWVKVRAGDDRLELLRVPPPYVTVAGGLAPTGYEINLGARVVKLPPEQIVHIRGYNPENPVLGLSPLETLRRILAEEFAMGDYREHLWQNAARQSGVILRPADAPEWSEAARARFKAEFEALYTGAANSGKTAILEEGMTWQPGTFSAQESEYLAGRKLTREECARAYHIPLPMVGILDHATYSNVREQHKHLYQDCLGPWLAMIEQDIELQLLPEFKDSQGVYVEFNIQEKLQGAFDEQVAALQSAVGRPWMTANEARARMNLPSMDGDADELVTPLNVLVGGQASPRDSAPDEVATPKALSLPRAAKAADPARGIDANRPEARRQHERKWEETMVRTFRRQQDAILGRIPAEKAAKQAVTVGELWDVARWNKELTEDLSRLNLLTALEWGEYVAEAAGVEFDESLVVDWLLENARIAAEQINMQTRLDLADALTQDEPRAVAKRLFELAIGVRAREIAASKVNTAANFGALEGAKQGGLRTKTWQVNSKNPRPAHAALDGVTVGIGELFPGVEMRWPGDPAGGAENLANCTCSVRFGRG